MNEKKKRENNLIKEKDYPTFTEPIGKDKFEDFVRDFKIFAPSKLPHAKQYRFFRELFWDNPASEWCDHLSLWMTDEVNRTYYAVVQPYMNKDEIMEKLDNDKTFKFCALYYKYKITVYTNHRYNWHNDNATFILIQLNDPTYVEPKKEPPTLEIKIA